MKLLTFLVLLFGSFLLSSQDTLVFETNYLGKNDTVLVFKPDNNEISESISAVYLLHGYGGDYKQWSKITDLQALANQYKTYIICPDGQYDSWYFDSPKQKKSEYESFFVKELYPEILKSYKIDSNNIFISGLSMGGHGAFYLFLRHPEMFNAAASTSGTLDLNSSSLKYSSLSNKLGAYNSNKDVFNKYSCINLLENIKFTEKPIFFDCGYQDHLYKSNLEFWEKAKSLRVNAVFKQSRGRHTSNYWSNSIIWHFVFFEEIKTNKE